MAADQKPNLTSEDIRRGHEATDLPAGRTFAAAVLLLVSLAVVLVITGGILRWLTSRVETPVRGSTAEEAVWRADAAAKFPPPRLQINPRGDLQELRAREDEVLKSYGWINRTAGVVRIPINHAMDLLLERGLPLRQESGPPDRSANLKLPRERRTSE